MTANPLALLSGAIAAPVALGLLTLVIPRRSLGTRVAMAAAGPIISLILLGIYVAQFGLHAGAMQWEWMPTLKLNLGFNADALGMFFALLISFIGLMIVLYARAYFGRDGDSLYRFYPSLMLFMTAMIGIVLSDSMMLMLLFWELTSVSSFLLIGWDRDKPEAVQKALQAFVVTACGGLALMGGLILLGVTTGVWNYSELLALKQSGALADTLTPELLTASFLLVFAGAAAKSAQWPLHFWLPGAMAAPTPVSAYLHSATMVKAGVYLVGRLWPTFADIAPLWPTLIVSMGAITMVWGAFVALQKADLKQIFAYTTVSQLGLLMCMYGLAGIRFEGEPNLIWDVTQIFNHALYKAPLFILAGAIGHVASRELPELRGFFYRGRTQRIMAILLLLAAYALAAGPLTLSFFAKEFFLYQIWHAYEATHNPWFYALIAAAVATAMFNVAIFIRIASMLLSRKPADAPSHDAHGGDEEHEHEHGLWPAFLWIPALIIVSVQYIGGIFPPAYEAMFGWLDPSRNFYEGLAHIPWLWQVHPGPPLYMSLTGVGLGIALGFAPVLRRIFSDPHDALFPGFYKLTTKGGGRVFGLFQNGHLTHYVALTALTFIGMFIWAGYRLSLAWMPDFEGLFEPKLALLPGYILTVMVCLTALLMPTARSRVTRVLILGSCGFSVTGVYYFYRAPDLALTQISIEIISLILFLLVLSLLPRETKVRAKPLMVGPRLVIATGVGLVTLWLTLASATIDRPSLPYKGVGDAPIANLGEYFLRNAHYGVDTMAVAPQDVPPGVTLRGVASDQPEPGQSAAVEVHPGGGGDNVVNVILVDFRGFDTMGEITVLGLAALGVWTLLRRWGSQSPREQNAQERRA